jgi:acyl-CoA reductase-like NAD-dependent aldehyde dehydrogenase
MSSIKLAHDETFRPVAPIIRFDRDEDAIANALVWRATFAGARSAACGERLRR